MIKSAPTSNFPACQRLKARPMAGRQLLTSNQGQTLIETLAALFILAMGVSAATGLAVYAFGTSSNINKQIIATGLSREALEAVRNMRDTNWLNDSLVPAGCYNYANTTPSNAPCYQNWLGKNGSNLFCITPDKNSGNGCNNNGTGTTNYTLGINAPGGNAGALWNLQKQGSGSAKYGMNFNTINNGTGFYTQDGNTICGSGSNPADYCRKIIITNYSTSNGNAISPYDKDPNLSLLYVQSEVWWVDKKCPRALDFSSASPACRIELDTYLTNWKNY